MTNETITVLPGEWLTTQEVMQAIQKSQRTVQEMAKAGLLKWKMAERAGAPPGRLYDADDVRKYIPAVPKPPRVERPHRRGAAGGTELAVRRTQQPQTLALASQTDALLRELTARFIAPRPQPVLISEKLWLSLDEAAEYSGLARTTLLELCQAEKVKAMKSGGWKISRKSLEAFE